MHGPNGSGKTTSLRLLEFALKSNLAAMKEIVFSELEIDFDDKTTLRITRGPSKNKQQKSLESFEQEEEFDDQIEIKISLKSGKTIKEGPLPVIDADKIEDIKTQVIQRPSMVERLSGGTLVRTAARAWQPINSTEVLGSQEVADYIIEKRIKQSLPNWYLNRVNSIKFEVIRAQRLFELNDIADRSERAPEIRQIVDVYSKDVVNKINQAIAQSALQFQKKEKTFPHRILAGEVKAETEATLRGKYIQLQSRINTLEEIGLQESSDSLTLPKIKLNPTHKRVLTLYLADMNEKLDVFNEIFQQIRLMSDLFSNKLRRKEFSINKAEGFSLESTSGDGLNFKPTDLSSGEQHQLVMLYKLIFSDAKDQLYLIDEPEISLHVEWQRQFSEDLRLIAEARGHRFLVATHSPQIINGRLDLAVPLDGGI